MKKIVPKKAVIHFTDIEMLKILCGILIFKGFKPLDKDDDKDSNEFSNSKTTIVIDNFSNKYYTLFEEKTIDYISNIPVIHCSLKDFSDFIDDNKSIKRKIRYWFNKTF